MAAFSGGDLVRLISDHSVQGAVVGIAAEGQDPRYRVFVNNTIQMFYESQLEYVQEVEELEAVDAARFHAGLTASLIRNPSLSSLYSLNGAKIDFIPHQFRPVLKFIKSDRPRILIADGVGVGKTIEAGLILREMEARRSLESVLVICPRPLVTEEKWQREMKRFDEQFTALDGPAFRYCIKEMDYEGEWPERYKKAVLPYSLFDEANVMGGTVGRKKRMGLMELNPAPSFDLVIVDEAHHIRNRATYAYRAVKQFCDNAEAVIFLTATPVQLEQDDLFVMLNLLRPDLVIDTDTFHNMAEPNAFINRASALIRLQEEGWQQEAYQALRDACSGTSWGRMVISKNPVAIKALEMLSNGEITPEDRVGLISDIESLHTFSNIISRTRRRDIGEFTLRKATTVEVEFTSAQKILHDSILETIHNIFSNIHRTDNTRFMMTTIRRQTASCLFGLVPLLQDILYRHVGELIDDDYLEDLTEADVGDIRGQIEHILELAKSLPPDDPKFERMLEIIEDKQRETKNKIMVFSSFRHTLRYLRTRLGERGYRIGLIHGGVDDEERRSLRARFEMDRNESEAIDIMLFSEVGCEGLDYQFCDCMINYDLPWNPMRIEQRIGRIDRNGQTSESVSIFNMVIPGTVDYDIYFRCLSRIGVFKQSIGDCEEILGSVSKEISEIVDTFRVNPEERQKKLQQLADNKIRLIHEQLALEERQRDLFGIRVPDTGLDKELKNATNFWLSPAQLCNMVHMYLKLRLEPEKDYILGEKELKTLRVSQAARAALLEDIKRYFRKRNSEIRAWEKKLQSGDLHFQITFDSACSKQNDNAILITMSHPLVKQAAAFLQDDSRKAAAFEVKTNRIPAGEYPFAVFQWKYIGEREDLQLKPISVEPELNKCFMDLIKNAKASPASVPVQASLWDSVEDLHHDLWGEEVEKHRARTRELMEFKKGSLTTSHNARMTFLNGQLDKASDKKIRTMREGEIRKAMSDYEMRMKELDDAAVRADVLSDTLAYGVLLVEADPDSEVLIV